MDEAIQLAGNRTAQPLHPAGIEQPKTFKQNITILTQLLAALLLARFSLKEKREVMTNLLEFGCQYLYILKGKVVVKSCVNT